MKWLEFIIKRKILVVLLVVLIAILGCVSIFKLDKELLPSVDMNGAYVNILAGDMAAVEVERKITTPLEKQLQGLDIVV
ncbi:efflux RND transporter permease subunit [Gracilibacillus massiliensis]|uniref:efflux RND transporter permease subunit n=1 Tax=Gracilibacillus massiliensis TaxID=1564956 RepID=UPI00071C69D9|nr:efflux RND transporter permease subunit [Gracilibacillus massiliensis]